MLKASALTLTPLLSALIAAFVLTACNRAEESRSPGQVLDQAIGKVEQKAKEVGAEVRAATTQTTGADGKSTSPLATAVRDVAITAEIKGLLAKDPNLSALRIDVDTTAGRVALRGTAPSVEARERATKLAQAVVGVSAVNNELSVKPGS